MCEQGPIANTDQSQTNFLLILHTFLPNSRCKRRTIRKRLKRQKKKGGKLLVDLVKLVEIAISPVLRKGLAEFEVAFTSRSLIFSEINGVAGFLLVSTWAAIRTRHGRRARVGLS